MYIYRKVIFLHETDATGVLYFSEQLKMGLEAFESYFFSKNFTLQQLLSRESFLMPIVHVEADYCLPLFVGDEVEIHLFLEKIGRSSFTLQAKILKKEQVAGSTKIIHVIVDKTTGKSTPIPSIILTHLQELGMDRGMVHLNA